MNEKDEHIIITTAMSLETQESQRRDHLTLPEPPGWQKCWHLAGENSTTELPVARQVLAFEWRFIPPLWGLAHQIKK